MSTNLPSSTVLKLIDDTFAHARAQLVEHGEVVPVAVIVGDGESGFVDMRTRDEHDKDQAAFAIRELVKVYQAHTVMLVSEIWTLPAGVSIDEGRALYAKYRTVSDMPNRIEAVLVVLETRDGRSWRAQAQILRKGRAVKLASPTIAETNDEEKLGRYVGFFAPPVDADLDELAKRHAALCTRCGKRLVAGGIHTCTPPAA